MNKFKSFIEFYKKKKKIKILINKCIISFFYYRFKFDDCLSIEILIEKIYIS
jgi:hypothetical protein